MDQLELWQSTAVGHWVGSVERAESRGRPMVSEELAYWLSRRLGQPVRLVMTHNRRTLLSCREDRGELRVRLHEVFLQAGREELEALARYMTGQDRRAGQVVDAFLERHGSQLRAPPRNVQPRGRFHDLAAILAEVNEGFFHGASRAQITWGSAGRRRRRRSIQLGCYVAEENLIRIHPCLDQAFVPRQYVAWVIFHEMLHEVLGIRRRSNHREVHPPEFGALEETFPGYLQCKQWEEQNLSRLLRFAPPRSRPWLRRRRR